MSIVLNNGVQNVKGTPAIITGDFFAAPLANTVAIGTVWIDNVTNYYMYQSNGTNWIQIAGGNVEVPTLQDVLNSGNSADDTSIILRDNSTNTTNEILGSAMAIVLFPFVRSTLYYDRLEILDYSTSLRQVSLYANKLRWIETTGGARQDLLPNTIFAGQTVYLPESNGTLALQDPPLQTSINTTPFTPTGTYNRIYRVIAGASSIVLNPANWVDRKTLTFCFDVTAVTFSVTGGATLRGIALVNITGLYYVTYLSSANSFYLSHTA